MIKAVVIDFDDTLCLTEAAGFIVENETLRRMGREPMSRAIHISTWGRPLYDVIVERSPGIDVEKFRVMHEATHAEYVAAGRMDYIPEENYMALDDLILEGKEIMLLTSRLHCELKHLLAPNHLLSRRIKAFYYRDIMRFHKPDPRAFKELLQHNSLLPHQCVYVGDSPGDAQAAGGAGLKFVANLESGLRQKHDFGTLKVDAFVDKFSGVLDTIRSLEARA